MKALKTNDLHDNKVVGSFYVRSRQPGRNSATACCVSIINTESFDISIERYQIALSVQQLEGGDPMSSGIYVARTTVRLRAQVSVQPLVCREAGF